MNDSISRQAAIETVKKHYRVDNDLLEVIAYEIEALPSAQPVVISKSENTTECEDAVSREAVLNEIHRYMEERDYTIGLLDDNVCGLPPVTPKQPGWIPTSQKPPEPFKLVLIQDYCGCYELNTYIPPRINPKQYPNGYWGEVGTVDFDYFDVEAWRPLPAPYRPEGENSERHDQ